MSVWFAWSYFSNSVWSGAYERILVNFEIYLVYVSTINGTRNCKQCRVLWKGREMSIPPTLQQYCSIGLWHHVPLPYYTHHFTSQEEVGHEKVNLWCKTVLTLSYQLSHGQDVHNVTLTLRNLKFHWLRICEGFLTAYFPDLGKIWHATTNLFMWCAFLYTASV